MVQCQSGASSRVRVHARASLKINFPTNKQTNKKVVQHTHSSCISPTKITRHVVINAAKTACNAGSAVLEESCRRLITSTSENVVVRYMCLHVLTGLKQKAVTHPLRSHTIAPTCTYTSTNHA